jgi:hypothetical protein
MEPERGEQTLILPSEKRLSRAVFDCAWRVLLFIAIFTPALLIQNRELNIIRAKPRLYKQSLYLPSGRNIRLISLGYDRFMADFIWLRSIQAFGGIWESDRNYQPIYHLFDVITDLDPYFVEAYTFGNLVIGDEGGDQRLGLDLIDKGIAKNPLTYKLPYWGGYTAYWQMNDPVLAKFYYQRAIKAPDVPGFVARILAYMELKSGRYQVAFEKYLRDWLEGIDNRDDVVADIASTRILDVINEWQVFTLRQAARKYVKMTGKDPQNIHDLEMAGAIAPYPLVIIPTLRERIRYYSNQPGKMVDRFQDILNASVRQNATIIPPHPRGYWYQFNPGLRPEDDMFIVDAEAYLDRMNHLLSIVRSRIRDFYNAHKRYPYSLIEIYKAPFTIPEPFGGEWIYYPFDGTFRSSTMPRL